MDIIFQIIFTVIGAFLSVVLTKLLVQNGRAIQEMSQRIDEGFRKMDEGFRKMDERTAKISELILLGSERTRGTVKASRR